VDHVKLTLGPVLQSFGKPQVTYYPGFTVHDAATKLQVRPGNQNADLEIKLQMAPHAARRGVEPRWHASPQRGSRRDRRNSPRRRRQIRRQWLLRTSPGGWLLVHHRQRYRARGSPARDRMDRHRWRRSRSPEVASQPAMHPARQGDRRRARRNAGTEGSWGGCGGAAQPPVVGRLLGNRRGATSGLRGRQGG
jgi:hypothetical protein